MTGANKALHRNATTVRSKAAGARVGQPQNWYSFTSGLPGITFGASFTPGGWVRADSYIDQGDAEANKALFDDLAANKDEIERAFGSGLEWKRLDDRRASGVAIYRRGTIEDESEASLPRQGMVVLAGRCQPGEQAMEESSGAGELATNMASTRRGRCD